MLFYVVEKEWWRATEGLFTLRLAALCMLRWPKQPQWLGSANWSWATQHAQRSKPWCGKSFTESTTPAFFLFVSCIVADKEVPMSPTLKVSILCSCGIRLRTMSLWILVACPAEHSVFFTTLAGLCSESSTSLSSCISSVSIKVSLSSSWNLNQNLISFVDLNINSCHELPVMSVKPSYRLFLWFLNVCFAKFVFFLFLFFFQFFTVLCFFFWILISRNAHNYKKGTMWNKVINLRRMTSKESGIKNNDQNYLAREPTRSPLSNCSGRSGSCQEWQQPVCKRRQIFFFLKQNKGHTTSLCCFYQVEKILYLSWVRLLDSQFVSFSALGQSMQVLLQQIVVLLPW